MVLVKRIWIAVFLLLSIQWVNAQTGLSIYTNDVTPDTVTLGTDISFNAIVRNDSNAFFFGLIGFGYNLNGDTTAITASDSSSGLQFNIFGASLNQGDTIPSGIVVHVSGPRFQVGPSVVVIWPICTNGHANDSLVLRFTVLQPTGISNTNDDKVRVFATGNLLHIESDAEIELKRVRIMNMLGEELSDQSLPLNDIPLPEMYRGIYLAEITYNNNQRKIFRFCY